MIWEQNTQQLQDPKTRNITFKFTASKTKYSPTTKIPDHVVSPEPADSTIDITRIDLAVLTGLQNISSSLPRKNQNWQDKGPKSKIQ